MPPPWHRLASRLDIEIEGGAVEALLPPQVGHGASKTALQFQQVQ